MPTHLPPNTVHPLTRDEWRAWLQAQHQRDEGVWLVSYKKASGKPSLGYDAVVEEALCFGWVDSKPRKLDEHRTMLWFSPRKPKSAWSRPNKERVARLMEQGLMHSSGLAKIKAAQADGSWTALDEVEQLIIPADLEEELARHPDATAHFNGFPRSAKRGILEWISRPCKIHFTPQAITDDGVNFQPSKFFAPSRALAALS
ncbi:MAG: hypothetical protein HEQ39_17410 [Rhizobacter sp.]